MAARQRRRSPPTTRRCAAAACQAAAALSACPSVAPIRWPSAARPLPVAGVTRQGSRWAGSRSGRCYYPLRAPWQQRHASGANHLLFFAPPEASAEMVMSGLGAVTVFLPACGKTLTTVQNGESMPCATEDCHHCRRADQPHSVISTLSCKCTRYSISQAAKIGPPCWQSMHRSQAAPDTHLGGCCIPVGALRRGDVLRLRAAHCLALHARPGAHLLTAAA